MLGVREKLTLGFGALLMVGGVVGVLTMEQINDLGKAIGIVLKENYRSVMACQDMKESLSRMDSGVLFTIVGHERDGIVLIDQHRPIFVGALDIQLNNITLPGEREKSEKIRDLFEKYTQGMSFVTQTSVALETRRSHYFTTLQPLFQSIQTTAQEILVLNQTHMVQANETAKALADNASRRLLVTIVVSTLLALLFSYLAHRWILRRINRLIETTDEIRQGNLNLVLETGGKDEIGRLSASFNEMAAGLRRVRTNEQIRLIRTRRATEEVFKTLPAPIAVLDLDNKVDIATAMAIHHFGFEPGVWVKDLGYAWLPTLIRDALATGRLVEMDPKTGYVQRFIDNVEYFFQPMAVPIPTGVHQEEPAGVVVIFKDVTPFYAQQELKLGLVSTVSHQLKTPLTSLRMSIHLLLDERVGTLSEKQAELLLAARDDSERLVAILNDLLDLNRIESGKSNFSPKPVSPRVLARDAIEPFVVEARNNGVTLTNDVADDLPDVIADPEKIRHVFANLLSNALRFTHPGGSVTVRAVLTPQHVRFFVDDTGVGIPPEHLKHIFEQFYRVPGQDEQSGVGLGLAIVKEIISAHGGEVGVESTVGQGSSFYFTLALALTDTPVEENSGPRQS